MSARLELWRPGQALPEEVPFAPADDFYEAIVAPFSTAGEASYRIIIDWEGGTARLPAPYTGFGGAYRIAIEGLPAEFTGRVSGQTRFTVETGWNDFDVVVQNTGKRAIVFDIGLTGPAAVWGQAPSTLEVPAGESRPLPISLDLPPGTPDGVYDLAVVLSMEATSRAFPLRLVVGEDTPVQELHEGEDASRGMPLPGVALIATALAAAGRRRR